MLSSFVAVDTETTGLDFENDRVIELAAVRFEDGKPVADFTALLSPGERSLSPVSRLITGLNDAELQAAPPAAETWRAFLDFAGTSPLVAHNAEFDAHFVRKSLEAASLPPLPGVWVDSLLLSRIAWPMWDSHRLDSLAERLNVPRDAEHRALPDARRAGYVFDAAQRYVRENISAAAWNDLVRLADALPDWSLVFHGEGGVAVATPANSGDRAASVSAKVTATDSGTSETDPEIPEAVAKTIAKALGNEQWLALEIPPRVEEQAEGLRAACAAAKTGQRVALAVPDLFAWNAVRKTVENLPPEFSAVRIVALAPPSGYLSRARLRALAENPARLPAEERTALLPLVAWADRNPEGPVADGRGFSPDRARLTWSRVCCDGWNDDASARHARDAAGNAGVVLVTHATLCAHLDAGGTLLPACDSVIVTGAHRFGETAQATGRVIGLTRLRDVLQSLPVSSEPDTHVGAGPEADPWFEPERRLLKFLQTAGRSATKQRPQGDFRVRYTEPALAAFGADPAPVAEALRDNLNFLQSVTDPETLSEPGSERRRLAGRLEAFRADFEALCEAPDAEHVHWMEDGANPPRASMRSAPVSLQGFGGTLRELFGAGVFLSPALVSGRDPVRDARFFLRSIGFDSAEAEITVHRLASPENKAVTATDSRQHPLFLMDPASPFLGTGEQAEVFARGFAEAVLPFADRGVRVFCPSQAALRALSGALRRLIPEGVPFFAQHLDGNRDAILRLYASGRGGIVLAAEGMSGLRDADGREPALWVVTRMPLLPPRDPLLEARSEAVREEGGNPKSELWHPAAVLRLKRDWALIRQGESRAGQSSGGTKVIWLLDGRAATEGLGARFAGALGCAPEDVASVKDLADLQAKTAAALPGPATRSPPLPDSQGLS